MSIPESLKGNRDDVLFLRDWQFLKCIDGWVGFPLRITALSTRNRVGNTVKTFCSEQIDQKALGANISVL